MTGRLRVKYGKIIIKNDVAKLTIINNNNKWCS